MSSGRNGLCAVPGRGNARLLRRQRVESKGSRHNQPRRRAPARGSLRSGVRKGSALRSDRSRGSLRSALTDGCAAAVLQLCPGQERRQHGQQRSVERRHVIPTGVAVERRRALQMSTNVNTREINSLAHALFKHVSVWKRRERSGAPRRKHIENKGRAKSGFRTRFTRGTPRCGDRQGSTLRFDERARGAPLTAVLAAGIGQL